VDFSGKGVDGQSPLLTRNEFRWQDGTCDEFLKETSEMAEPVRQEATYEDLCSVPENMTEEIIDGELIVTPRPARRRLDVVTR